MKTTDIIIIGAGPTGLFTVFEAGLLRLRCHLVDSLPQADGQLTEIYPKKPIYDIPGFPSVLAGDLVENLLEQIAPFQPSFTLGERAEQRERLEDGTFRLITSGGTVIQAPVVAIAGGLGCFEPRKPPIDNIGQYENNGVEYIIKDPSFYAQKRVLVAGGGDSALDWSIHLASIAKEVTLVHRRNSFRAAPDSVSKAYELAEKGQLNIVTDAQVVGLNGQSQLEEVLVKPKKAAAYTQPLDHFIPLFGLSPKLGTLADWGLNIDKNAIEVNAFDYQTNVDGVYAIGDINTYPGKLKLILCGFHEATLMVQSAFKRIYPDKKLTFKYTTVNGVNRF